MKDKFKKESKTLYLYKMRLIAIVLITSVFSANASKNVSASFESIQQSQINGTITDDSGVPLGGANILVKGTSIGAVADFDGNYTLKNVPASAQTLVFSFIGYKTTEVSINGQSTINVSLLNDASALDEVVVIGYGVVKKSDLTGAVSSVKSEELVAIPTSSPVTALQGRAAGVQIQSNNGGDPGAGFKMRIRGSTSINASSDPLFVVDGFVGGVLPAPADIASMEILKDASATAIYGSRGANGVVLVTTKKGSKGKMRVELNSTYSTQKEIGREDVLNREQFLAYMSEATNGAFQPGPAGVDTDWQDLILQQGGIHNHQLSVSGGGDKSDYYVSGNFFDQQGVVIGSEYKKFTLVSNINLNVSEKVKVGLNIIGTRAERNGSKTGGGGHGNAYPGATNAGPDIPVYNPDGSYALIQLPTPYDNPVAAVTEPIGNFGIDQLQVNLSAEYKIIDDLIFKTTFGSGTSNDRTGNYTPKSLLAGGRVDGIASINSNRSSNIQGESYFNYKKTFGDVDFSATAGYSFQETKRETFSAGVSGFVSDLFTYNNLGASAVQGVPSSSLTETSLSSYIGRINVGFSDKLIFTFSGRYDGSSVFSEGNKWAFFPSGAIAYNIGNESFLEDSATISNMKIRASYGITGNQAVSPYQTFAAFGNTLTVVGGSIVNALRPTQISNANLSWEETAQFNFGLDVGLLKNKINLTLDIYSMETTDLLFNIPLPSYSGFSSQLQNIGSMTNKGFEFTIDANVINKDEFSWDTRFNISSNKNEVTALPEGNDIFYGFGPGHLELRNPNILREGEPLGSYWGYNFLGVYQSGDVPLAGGFGDREGDGKYADLNNDGTLGPEDKAIIGDPNPDFIWGWDNNLKYKNFDLNIFFQASQGNDKFSYTKLELNSLTANNNVSVEALNRWTPSNTDSNYPRARNGGNRALSDRFVYDGSYIRCKNITLGYNFPSSVINKLKLSSLRLSLGAQNLFTITDYPGVDPEQNWGSGGNFNSNATLGFDYSSYPTVKSVTFGLNVGF